MDLLTSIAICAIAASFDPSSAAANAAFADSYPAVTAAESISSSLTASGHEMSYIVW